MAVCSAWACRTSRFRCWPPAGIRWRCTASSFATPPVTAPIEAAFLTVMQLDAAGRNRSSDAYDDGDVGPAMARLAELAGEQAPHPVEVVGARIHAAAMAADWDAV